MIFQDPQASLNGRMKIRDIVAEGLDIHGLTASKAEREERVQELLDLVGLNKDHLTRYPMNFLVVNVNGLGLPVLWQLNLNLSLLMNLSQLSMCRFRPR